MDATCSIWVIDSTKGFEPQTKARSESTASAATSPCAALISLGLA
jgi:hypothetical protein